MAIDLLQQLEKRQVEWPFDQPQAQTRIEQMMKMAVKEDNYKENDTRNTNESQRSSILAEISTSLNTDRFTQQRSSRNQGLGSSLTSLYSGYS